MDVGRALFQSFFCCIKKEPVKAILVTGATLLVNCGQSGSTALDALLDKSAII